MTERRARGTQRTNDTSVGATYTPPFKKHDAESLRALGCADRYRADPIWSEIHDGDGPTCGSCRRWWIRDSAAERLQHRVRQSVQRREYRAGGDVAEPGDPTMSWIMHKLDGTQGGFTAMCSGMFCGSQMPLGGDPLAVEVRDAIRTWIMDGALNDCP
jgi:hypothetical protein